MTAEDCILCCSCNHSPYYPYATKHAVGPVVAGWTILNDFRARAQSFGMDIGSADWAEIQSKIGTFEAFYKTKIKAVNASRDRLYTEVLDTATIKGLVDDMHNILKSIDYSWVETAVACRQLIPDAVWTNYQAWVDAQRTALNP